MKRLNVVLIVVVLIVAVLLSTMVTGSMQKIQAGFLNLVGPFLRAGSGMQQQFAAMKEYDDYKAKYTELLAENKSLRATNQVLRDLENENQHLRAALEYNKRSEFKLVAARVISRDASTWWNTIKINRGFEDGIKSDQPVLTDVGLVGKTTTVAKNETIVQLITDETCRVAAQVEGTRQKGICSGLRVQDASSPGDIQLNFLEKTADLQPGQKVFTAGVSGGVFPFGILVGEVQSFKIRPLDGQAIVKPAVDIPSLEDVFVVVGAK